MKEVEESLLIIKTTEVTDEVKQSRALDSSAENTRERDCKYETKSSLGLNFW